MYNFDKESSGAEPATKAGRKKKEKEPAEPPKKKKKPAAKKKKKGTEEEEEEEGEEGEEDEGYKTMEKKFNISTMPEICWKEFLAILQDLR
jgi:hypothetical protein